MQLLSLSLYQDLIEGARILNGEVVAGRTWPKVLYLQDGSILKLFRAKHLVTTARLIPPAARFARNVKGLEAARIPTVSMAFVYKIPAIRRTAVRYWPLEGLTLREHCRTSPLDTPLAIRLGRFLLSLHDRGIYFRSVHFGNIILTSDERIGLIDVLDMRFRGAPLRLGLRLRNLRHLFRSDTDIDSLAPARNHFLDAYCAAACLRPRAERRLRHHFEGYFQKRPREAPAP